MRCHFQDFFGRFLLFGNVFRYSQNSLHDELAVLYGDEARFVDAIPGAVSPEIKMARFSQTCQIEQFFDTIEIIGGHQIQIIQTACLSFVLQIQHIKPLFVHGYEFSIQIDIMYVYR